MFLRRATPFRLLTALVLALAWLSASNHCAVARLAGQSAKADAPGCRFCRQNAPAGPKTPAREAATGCCRAFKTVAEKASSLLPAPASLAAAGCLAAARLPVPAAAAGELPSLAPGPPGLVGFASRRYQRCHPACAPPRPAL